MDDSITPKTITDQSIPLIDGGMSTQTGSTTNPVTSGSDNATPDIAPDPVIPQAVVAVDTISNSINTETKEILGPYTFEQLGAIKIGTFKQAVSGEIKISPDGIVATNKENSESFRLDGETGDATFKGTVQAEDFVISDKDGLVSLSNFKSNNLFNGDAGFSTGALADVPGSTLDSFVLKRNTHVLIYLMFYGRNDTALTSLLANGVILDLVDSIGGGLANILATGIPYCYTPDAINFNQGVGNILLSRTSLVQMDPGIHTLKLTCQPLGGGNAILAAWEIGYVILGN